MAGRPPASAPQLWASFRSGERCPGGALTPLVPAALTVPAAGCVQRRAPRGRPLPGGSAKPLCLQITAARLHLRGDRIYHIHACVYMEIIGVFRRSRRLRSGMHGHSPFAVGMREMATCFRPQLCRGSSRSRGRDRSKGRSRGRGWSRGRARRCPRSPAARCAARCAPLPSSDAGSPPSPGCGVPGGAPSTQRAALTHLAEREGQVAKTYQQNASPGPHRGLVHFRHGGKATLMERSCRPAPAAQKFSTIPQGKGSGVARGSSASRLGVGACLGAAGVLITALPLFVGSPRYGSVAALSLLLLSLAPLGS